MINIFCVNFIINIVFLTEIIDFGPKKNNSIEGFAILEPFFLFSYVFFVLLQ